jgi:hypothetical protein
MPGPYDYIPPGKKAIMVEGVWKLVDLDPKVQDDAVTLLAEEKLLSQKQAGIIKQLEDEVERLKIRLLESNPQKSKK